MQWYKNLKIQHKLNGGFGLILICFLGMALGLAAINKLPIIVSKALLGNGNMCIDIAHVAMAVDAYQINQDRGAALAAIDEAQQAVIQYALQLQDSGRLLIDPTDPDLA